ncbi:GntR family transcriptional regulator [Undibacterium sp. SXout7W]|uniref:GntR family transcriptional regulator n=1 Tax=Undibacterium sp. SXout7W TaxID=3413049 RepID=UPI003BF3DB94
MGAKETFDIPLSERAFQLLRGKILRCEYEPGEKLKMDTLQRDLGLSSSPLREALSRLAVEGLVVSDERRGFTAAPVSLEDLREVTRLRLMLDCEALSESIDCGDDQWEANIVAAFHWLSRIEERHGEGPLTLDADWTIRHKDFHMALLAACKSRKLIRLSSALFDQSERYRRLSIRYRVEPRQKAAEHGQIMEVVLSRNKAEAVAMLHDHISRTADNVAAVLEKRSVVT